jgi:hypothetical protein
LIVGLKGVEHRGVGEDDRGGGIGSGYAVDKNDELVAELVQKGLSDRSFQKVPEFDFPPLRPK